MDLAEFEEKEFEKPLYNQLEDGSREVWTPGQCFEYYCLYNGVKTLALRRNL